MEALAESVDERHQLIYNNKQDKGNANSANLFLNSSAINGCSTWTSVSVLWTRKQNVHGLGGKFPTALARVNESTVSHQAVLAMEGYIFLFLNTLYTLQNPLVAPVLSTFEQHILRSELGFLLSAQI